MHDAQSPSPASAPEPRPASAFPLDLLADTMSRGFAGYFVPVVETAESLAWRIRYDSIDLSLSRLAERNGSAAGLCLVSARGGVARIAAMGVVEEARRAGVGRQLMEVTLDLLRRRGFARVRLEVIEQNQSAFRLYQSSGLEAGERLVGFGHTPSGELPSRAALEDAQRLRAIDVRALSEAIGPAGDALPWQLQPASLLAYGPPARTWELDGAMAVVTGVAAGAAGDNGRDGDSGEPPVTASVQALWVPPAERRTGKGRRLVEALRARHPAERWTVAARVPEGLADAFASAVGFERAPLTQLEMALDL